MDTDWQLRSADGVQYFEYSPHPKLILAFCTRRGGVSHDPYESLNTSFAVGDDSRNVEENLARVRRALRLLTIQTVKQTHSDTVLPIAGGPVLTEMLTGDACITDQAGMGLGLKVADCLPVYLYAEDSGCIGIAHCGWRGTAAKLAEKTARELSRHFSVQLSNLRFALGPCICPNCYEVGDDVRAEFEKSFPVPDKFFSPVAGTAAVRHSPVAEYRLDIRAANRWLLMELGLLETRSIALCTFEDDRLCYSARRDKTTGRNLAVIALR
ncbi:peptidoglycan editing factor PgeF [candidate division WOR-3 bacterium]|nr:peptidoglycan editing factor PgeF [candidate division WOR-3 bacterium]